MFKCLLCASIAEPQLVSSSLRDDTSNMLNIVRCLSCGHVQVTPLPDAGLNSLFYDTDQQSLSLISTPDFELIKQKTSTDTLRRVKWLHHCQPDPTARVLDIGCGYGFFINQLTLDGYQACGMDISLARMEFAKKHQAGEFIRGLIDASFVEQYRGQYQVITLFHVLEHVYEPDEFLRLCFELLSPGGQLLIEVPNLNDELLWQNEKYRSFYWQRAHVSYFDPSRLNLLIQRTCGRSAPIKGVQRYGIYNLLQWVQDGGPQLSNPSFEVDEPSLMRLEQLYREDRERALTSDTLIVQVQKSA